MKNKLTLLFFITSSILFAQENSQDLEQNDTVRKLNQITVYSKALPVDRLPEIQGNLIFSGKKNEVLHLSSINANVTTNNARQVFAKVPGVSVWENEGSGIQINIGVRGLSPNRSWELNTRQNGYDISSDVFGYPEAYYNPPLEAVESIQFVRGGASLQFGPQFGGMVNYVLKREKEKPFSFETQNTVGSFGLLSSYNAIGGKLKKFSYYLYNHSRKGNGWRENSRYEVRNTHGFVEYQFNEKTKLSGEFTNMDYEMQQAGGLTDIQFNENPQQSFRERNWLGTPWNVASINFDTKLNSSLTLNVKAFGLIGERNSVGFTATPDTKDAINTTSLEYANRQVDRDFYKNIGLETRSIFSYSLGKQNQNLAFGARIYNAKTTRKQLGKGTTGSDFDLGISDKYPRELNYETKNFAFFAENLFKITKNLSVTPGIRFENIRSSIEGRLNITAGNAVAVAPNELERNKILGGLGVEYKMHKTNFYTNFSQAYRPVLFSDLTPPASTDIVDPNLKDADGFNFDLGYRGTLFDVLNFDVNYFYLRYNNRIGGLRKYSNNDPTQGTYLYRTNLGESINKGFEGYADINISKAFKINNQIGAFHFFATISDINAKYANFEITKTSGSAPNVIITTENLKGKRVEYAPSFIYNFGLTWDYKNFSTTLQNRRSGLVYTDANNTENPSANGVTGKLEGYKVYDLSMEYSFLGKKLNVRGGINNLNNTVYATRRSSGYPGPGILPNEGRSFYLSIGAKL